MASVVCQGLQTQLVQNPKLDPNAKNGFSFLNLLEKPTATHVKNEEVYVHPMAKRSASALSKMSLEMCTESLGTETGSDEFKFEEKERSKPRGFDRKMVSRHHSGGAGGGGGGFPPPLTSIKGSECTLNVRPHREGGRLVIKAVSVSDCGTKFESERIDGRLKLSLLKGCCVNVESRRAKMKISGIEKVCCESDVGEMSGNMRKHGGKTGARLARRPPRFPNSDDLAEFGLTRWKDGGNRNKVMKNWSLFRVVIS